jgi:hypothetical protein
MVLTRLAKSHAALILEENVRHLIISDLHIGFENTFVTNDIYIEPSIIVEEASNEIISLFEAEKADSLILLGDIKASVDSISKIEWQAIPRFFEMIKKINTTLIPGNHDGNIQRLLPDNVRVTSPAGIVLGDTLLTHGHTMPSENLSQVNKIIIGHVHPVFFQEGSVLDGQRVWVSLKTEKNQLFPSLKGELEILIVPTFNKYFYASHKKYKKSISPILERVKKIHSAKIVTLEGSIIGNESMLENVI